MKLPISFAKLPHHSSTFSTSTRLFPQICPVTGAVHCRSSGRSPVCGVLHWSRASSAVCADSGKRLRAPRGPFSFLHSLPVSVSPAGFLRCSNVKCRSRCRGQQNRKVEPTKCKVSEKETKYLSIQTRLDLFTVPQMTSCWVKNQAHDIHFVIISFYFSNSCGLSA